MISDEELRQALRRFRRREKVMRALSWVFVLVLAVFTVWLVVSNAHAEATKVIHHSSTNTRSN